MISLKDKVVVVTGSTGALAGSAARYLASEGARVAFLGRDQKKLDRALLDLKKISPHAQVLGLVADVLDREALEKACKEIVEQWQGIDGLVNGAGGNMPGAMINPDQCFGDLNMEDLRQVIDLNLLGSVLPSLVFSKPMLQGERGSIVNFSSVAAAQAVTRGVGYSMAKSGIDNFTRWLSLQMAKESGGKVRVNAVLPGFFLGDQNRQLLMNADGGMTERGETILRNTPFERLGEAHELHGAIHYFLSEASSFTTGTVLPVDGGFTSFSGV